MSTPDPMEPSIVWAVNSLSGQLWTWLLLPPTSEAMTFSLRLKESHPRSNQHLRVTTGVPNPPSLPLWCHHSWSKSQTESESKKGIPKSQASLVPVLTEKPRHWKQLKAIIESNLNSKYMGFQRKKTAMK